MSNRDYVQRRLGASSPLFFRIAYWVPHLVDNFEDATPFQAFLPGIVDTARLFDQLIGYPMDVRELFASRADMLFCRDIGITSANVFPVDMDAFSYVAKNSGFLFNCVLTNDLTRGQVCELLDQAKLPWLHLSNVGADGVEAIFEDVSDETFSRYFQRNARSLPTAFPVARIFDEFLEAPLRRWPRIDSEYSGFAHNVARPNEMAMAAMGVEFRDRVSVAPVRGAHVAASVQSARALSRLRDRILRGRPSRHGRRITVALDSLTWTAFRTGYRALLIQEGVSKEAASVVASIIDRTGYYETPPATSLEDLINQPVVQEALQIRSSEMTAFTSALLMHGGFELTPTVRLDPGLNKLRSSLFDLSACARGNGPHRDFKLNKLARRLTTRMVEVIGGEAMSELRGAADAIQEITVVCDLPLEWVPVNGMPLALRHDVSRIPATPGNLLFSQCVDGDASYVSRSSLQEILVIRSFQLGDPIAGHLEAALDHPITGAELEIPRVRFVDVQTADEFVCAVSEYRGSLLIVDGHGARDAETGVGSIVVGDAPLDIWSLRPLVRMPPIVLLSACDTLPLDGSHGSAALSMIALGAKAVLGTLLPVSSVKSSAFLRRLLWRITAFLPLVLKQRPDGISWRYFLSGMLRMVYASELIDLIEKDFPSSELAAIRVKANMDINMRDSKWLTKMQRRLAAATKQSVRDVESFMLARASLTDSLKYVQLGRPDLVRVVEVSPNDVMEELRQDVGRKVAATGGVGGRGDGKTI